MNDNDKELLELAAKAVGYDVYFDDINSMSYYKNEHNGGEWNPLDNSDDAFRLAVKLRLGVDCRDNDKRDQEFVFVDTGWHLVKTAQELIGNDIYAATRKAIVKAAAEIGRVIE